MTNEKALYKATKTIWYVFYIVQTLLFFRFILKLLGANAAATFTNLIYTITTPLVAPFRFVFGTNNVGGSTIEWSVLLAMIVYWFIAWAIVKFIIMGRSVDTYEAERSLEAQDEA